jgi:hypothetical protein
MKKIILICALLTTTTTFAANTNDIFSKAKLEEVLKDIDSVCSDSWCEGDYNFKFNQLSCSKANKSCALAFQFIKTDEQEVETYSPVQVCKFENITNFKQLKDNKYGLNDKFYEDITDCISTLEGTVEF